MYLVHNVNVWHMYFVRMRGSFSSLAKPNYSPNTAWSRRMASVCSMVSVWRVDLNSLISNQLSYTCSVCLKTQKQIMLNLGNFVISILGWLCLRKTSCTTDALVGLPELRNYQITDGKKWNFNKCYQDKSIHFLSSFSLFSWVKKNIFISYPYALQSKRNIVKCKWLTLKNTDTIPI